MIDVGKIRPAKTITNTIGFFVATLPFFPMYVVGSVVAGICYWFCYGFISTWEWLIED